MGVEPDWRALASAWPDGRVKFALMRGLLALRRRLADIFADGSYRPLATTGPHRSEIVAFARLSGRNAVIVVTGRRFGRATEKGRKWPSGGAWKASIVTEGFSAMSDVFAGGKVMTGPTLAASDLFDVLPVAVLQAQYTPARRERPRIKRPRLRNDPLGVRGLMRTTARKNGEAARDRGAGRPRGR